MTPSSRPTTDKQGREYVHYDNLGDGQRVYLDGGFTCHPPGPVTVQIDGGKDDSPYFDCESGRHDLDGQRDERGFCVGVYANDPGEMKWEHEK